MRPRPTRWRPRTESLPRRRARFRPPTAPRRCAPTAGKARRAPGGASSRREVFSCVSSTRSSRSPNAVGVIAPRVSSSWTGFGRSMTPAPGRSSPRGCAVCASGPRRACQKARSGRWSSNAAAKARSARAPLASLVRIVPPTPSIGSCTIRTGASTRCAISMARPMPPVSPCAPWLCSGTSTPTGLARAATTRLVALRSTTSMASSITPTGSTTSSSPPPWEGENYEPRNPMESEEIQPPGCNRENLPASVQSFSPQHEAARHLAGIRVFLDARSARRATRHAAHRAHEAPSRLPTADGLDQAIPAPAGAGILPAAECALTGPLQLLRRARELPLAQPLFPLGHGLYVQMAQPAGRQAKQLHLGAVYPAPRPRQDNTALYHGGQTSGRVCLKALLCTAETSTTEEPDAGKLHVRDCTGGAG